MKIVFRLWVFTAVMLFRMFSFLWSWKHFTTTKIIVGVFYTVSLARLVSYIRSYIFCSIPFSHSNAFTTLRAQKIITTKNEKNLLLSSVVWCVWFRLFILFFFSSAFKWNKLEFPLNSIENYHSLNGIKE